MHIYCIYTYSIQLFVWVFTPVIACTCMYLCMLTPEADADCLSTITFYFYSLRQNLTEAKIHSFSYTRLLMSFRGTSDCLSPISEFIGMHNSASFLCVLCYPVQVLMLVQQVPYLTRCFSFSPYLFFKKEKNPLWVVDAFCHWVWS